MQEGKAYLCFCSQEELERERDAAMAEHRSPIYSGKCRGLDPAEVRAPPREWRGGGDPAGDS